MIRLAALAMAILATGCTQREPVTLECSIDDTVVFVAFGVNEWGVADVTEPVLYTYGTDGRMVRRMVANETCREVVL